MRKLHVMVMSALFAGCAGTGELDWEGIAPEDASLLFEDEQGLLSSNRHERGERPGQATLERSFWSSRTGERAQLHLIALHPDAEAFSTATQNTMVDEVAAAWEGTDITLGTNGNGDNGHGRYEYLRFSAPPRDCVAVRQYFPGEGAHSAGGSLGTRALRGWYCAPPGQTVTAKRMASFFDGYALKPEQE